MTYEEIIESARTINGLIKVYDFKGKNLEALVRAKYALEKQIPKNSYKDDEYTTCECGVQFRRYEIGYINEWKYCPFCGQAIDWSE